MRRDASVLATGALLGSLFFAALALVACPSPEPFHPATTPPDPPPHALVDEWRATNAAADDVDRLMRQARAAAGGAGGCR